MHLVCVKSMSAQLILVGVNRSIAYLLDDDGQTEFYTAKFFEFGRKSRENGQNLDFTAKQISYGQNYGQIELAENMSYSTAKRNSIRPNFSNLAGK